MSDDRTPLDPEEQWDGDFLLDREFRFVSISKTIRPSDAPVGRLIWDAYGGESVFGAPYESVFLTGEPVRFRAYFDGIVIETWAELHGRFLRVRYRVLVTVDISTLDRLLETMRLATIALGEPFGTPAPQPGLNPRRSKATSGGAPLRVIPNP
ncbi:MAG: hypothetical protein ACKO8G_08500 [Actinomycetota bacterium]